MAKKQILTNTEIEKDIIAALKNPPKMAEASYEKGTVPAIILAILLVIIEFIYPLLVLWFLLACLAFLIGNCIFKQIRLKKQIKNVSVNDYHITTQTVHSIKEEHYQIQKYSKYRFIRRSEQIDNYIIRFENGKEWRIPKELYAWNERLRLSDEGVFNSIHREDVLLVVTKKDTDEIVVAYHTDVFEYKI